MIKSIKLFSEEDIIVIAKHISENIKRELQIQTQKVVLEEEFLNIEELTKLIGLTKPTIYGHVHRNTIPYIKKGKMLRFSKLDILHWLENGKNNSKSDLEAKANEYLAKKPLFNR